MSHFKKENPEFYSGQLQPVDVNATLGCVGYRIEQLARVADLPPSVVLGKYGIVLHDHIIDSWDYVNLGRFVEFEPNFTIVESVDIPLCKVSKIRRDDE